MRNGWTLVSVPVNPTEPFGARFVGVLDKDCNIVAGENGLKLVGNMSADDYRWLAAAASQLPNGTVIPSSENGKLSCRFSLDADLSPSAIQAPARFYPDSAKPNELAIKVLEYIRGQSRYLHAHSRST